MRKRLLLVRYNFSADPTGIGKYGSQIVSWLLNRGYDCKVITSYPYYPFWKVQQPHYKRRFWFSVEEPTDPILGGKLRIFRCPQYVPSRPSVLKRTLLDVSFFISACVPALLLLARKKFDYIMTITPSFKVGLFGVLFRKLQNAKFKYHIQDLQIEACNFWNREVDKVSHYVPTFSILNRCVLRSILPGMPDFKGWSTNEYK